MEKKRIISLSCVLFFVVGIVSCTQPTLSTQAYARKVEKKKLKRKRSKDKDILESSLAKKIYKRQGKRLFKINSYKKRNHIGESTDGLLLIRSLEGVKKNESAYINKLVKIENSDRNRIYGLITKKKNYNKNQEKVLRKSMFESRFDLEPVGTYYYSQRYWQKK